MFMTRLTVLTPWRTTAARLVGASSLPAALTEEIFSFKYLGKSFSNILHLGKSFPQTFWISAVPPVSNTLAYQEAW